MNADLHPRKHRQFEEYKKGTFCFLKRVPRRDYMDWKEKIRYKLSAKLQSRFTGPYLIVRQLSPVLYVAIVDSKEKTIHTVNMKHTPLVRDQSSTNLAAARRRDQNRIHGAKVSEMQTALPEVSSKIPERQ